MRNGHDVDVLSIESRDDRGIGGEKLVEHEMFDLNISCARLLFLSLLD